MTRFLALAVSTFFSLISLAPAAFAATGTNEKATIWGMNLVPAVSPVKERIHDFHSLLLIIITAIVVFVCVVLGYTLIRFRRARNPVSSKTIHNVPLEIIWTLVPCLILLIIVVPSFRLMYYMDRTDKPDLTLKVTGYQWYWGYSYPDQEIEEYTNYMVPSESDDPKGEAKALRDLPTYQRLLSTYDITTNAPSFVVVPVQKNVRVLVTGGDVLHSFALPAMGVKKDAVPGRSNETWMRIERPGIYYGQCSEICGIKHGFMPIEVRAVPQEQFEMWADMMKKNPGEAMAYIQDNTVQYAAPHVAKEKLTLAGLWHSIISHLNNN